MSVKVNSEQLGFLLAARKKSHLTQLELSEKSKVSLRTIKDLESGRRSSFSESTIILLCRALDLDVREILGDQEMRRVAAGNLKMRWLQVLLLITIAISIAVILVKLNILKDNKRIDWITNERILVSMFPPDWGDGEGSVVNYYHIKQVAECNEVLPTEIKWFYHFREGSTPVFYISCFTEWNPDTEIRLFNGTLSGEGHKIFQFEIQCPDEPRYYRIRVFFASAFAPISSFYGHPPHNQLVSPSSARYLEIPIEVIKSR